MARRRWIPAVAGTAALAVGASALAFFTGASVAVANDFGPGDGLQRYVVRASAPAAGVTGFPAVDPQLLAAATAELGQIGHLDLVGGRTWYVTPLSSRVVSRPGAPVLDAVPGEVDRELLAALDGSPGVRSAQLLPDGTALVATSGSEQALRQVPGVTDVQESATGTVAAQTPSDPYFSSYGWNVENTGSNSSGVTAVAGVDTDAPEGWDSTTGAGTVIAVVDTGYDSDHPDLSDALWTNPSCGSDTDGDGITGDCHGWNFATDSSDIDNGPGGAHGTNVAGAAAARRDNGQGNAGIAPDAKIMPLVVGTGKTVDINLGAKAIRYAADHGADVINASWGGQPTGSDLATLRSAVQYAGSKGVLVVVAAGNDNLDRDTSLYYPASLTEENVVTVGSLAASGAKAPTSAYGHTSVDVFAPGDRIVVPWNDGNYMFVSGTSLASPQVAAGVALYRSVRPRTGDPVADMRSLRAALLADVTPQSNLQSISVSGGRMSLAHLAADATVHYGFAGAGTVVGAQQHPVVTVQGGSVAGHYSLQVGILAREDGELWGVTGVPVTVDQSPYTTDSRGEFTVDLGSSAAVNSSFTVDTELPNGEYVVTAQLVRDGNALTRPWAAPLIVSDTPAATPTVSPTTAPSTVPSASPSTSAAPSAPSASSSTSSATTSPAPSTPSASSTPGSTVTSTSAPSAPEIAPSQEPTGAVTTSPEPTTAPTSAPTTAPTSAPSVSPSSTTEAANPSTTSPAPSVSSPTTTSPTTTAPTAGAPTPAPSASSTPTTTTFPGTGRFVVTSLSPATVSTAGGTMVTIQGTDLDQVGAVRIGDAVTAEIVNAYPTQLQVRVPARIAGRYDVTLFQRGSADLNNASVLPQALTYVDADGNAPTTAPTSAPASPSPSSSATSSTPVPSASSSSPTTPGSSPSATSSPTPSATRTRGTLTLVRRTDLGNPARVFATGACETSCAGAML
ncbi:S8 family serine peptidase [Kineococcus sp. GCM10028916]|uniref:S8 family serine peptidase n=1 Tax=Kineococcus sp. GCM10028916 TaxID=3273394 RepID=UPI003645E01A